MATSDGLRRAIEFERELDRRRAELAVRSRHGIAYLSPSLPRVYDLNQFVVDLGASATAPELIDEADRVLGSHGLTHRKIAIDDEFGAGVQSSFDEAGWACEELLVMLHVTPAPHVDISRVEEVEADRLVPVWDARMRREYGEEVTAQLIRAQLGRRDAVQVRYFAAMVDGRPASYCELFTDSHTGQVESVMTEPEFRGRGLGKAVVAGALAASQSVHDFTFIVADAHDWPKELYRKLGFQPAGSVYRFLLRSEDR